MWAFRDPPFFVFFFHIFLAWDEWSSLWSFGSLSIPLLRSLLMWLHFMLDLSGSSLHFVLFVSPSFSFLLLIHHFRFTPCSYLTVTHFRFDIFLASFLRISLSVWFASFASSLILYSHWASSGPWLTSFSIHVAFYTRGNGFLIIWYLSLVFLHFCYLITQAYVTSRVLRPPWVHGTRCRLQQPLLGQVFEIWLIFRYHHAFSSRRRLFDVWTRFSCGYWLLLKKCYLIAYN